MKKLLLLLSFCVLLCGCNSFAPQDNIINLLSAPKLNQNESKIAQAIEDYIKRDINLKYPKKSNSISPINIIDIDNNNVNDAIVFYNAPSISGNVRMAILTSTLDGWVVNTDTEGFGTDIYKIDFDNISNTDQKNIAVGYTFADSTEKLLSIYTINGKSIQQTTTYSCQDYIICDATNDGVTDIVLVGNNADTQLADISIIGSISRQFVTMARHNLETTNARIINISITNTDNRNKAILVDYYDPYKFIYTEVFEYGNNSLNRIQSANTVVKEWLQPFSLISMDVDNDKYLETPTIITDTDTGCANIKYMEWTTFYTNQPIRKLYGICDTINGIFIALPDEWQNYITITEKENGGYLFESIDNTEIFAEVNIYTSRAPIDNNSDIIIPVGTMQIAFSFNEIVTEDQVNHITKNIIYLK